MRKWMRDRLQGRKKKAAEPSDQKTPPPLQPAYFEAEQQSSDAVSNEGHSEPEASAAPEPDRSTRGDHSEDRAGTSNSPEASSSEADSTEIQPTTARPARISAGRDARGRRRRGGRGRGGRGREQAVAQAFAPAAVKGAIPVTEAVEAEAPIGPAHQNGDPVSAPPRKGGAVSPPLAPLPKGVVVLAIA